MQGPEGVKWELGFAYLENEIWVTGTGNRKQKMGMGSASVQNKT